MPSPLEQLTLNQNVSAHPKNALHPPMGVSHTNRIPRHLLAVAGAAMDTEDTTDTQVKGKFVAGAALVSKNSILFDVNRN